MVSPKLVIIVGPTAVGKTDLALRLAHEFGGEIISADSMQVYRYMDIGTAKPSAEERRRVRHHLLDVVNPDEPFNAALFVEAATSVIRDLHRRMTPIFIVGGTGLYIRALLGGLIAGPAADEHLRSLYRRQQEIEGGDYLYRELQRVDDRAARQINPRDTVRIIRALEVMALTGLSIAEKQDQHGFLEKKYDYIKIGLTMERSALFDRIDNRTRAMVEAGLVDEVRRLFDWGYGADLKPMQSMGYKHVIPYLKGHIGLDDVIERTKHDTKRYAKRQGTWFRSEADVEWFSPNDFDMIKDIARRFLASGKPEIA